MLFGDYDSGVNCVLWVLAPLLHQGLDFSGVQLLELIYSAAAVAGHK